MRKNQRIVRRDARNFARLSREHKMRSSRAVSARSRLIRRPGYGGLWTNPRDDLVRDRGDLPIGVFAAEQLTRRWQKVRKKGRALAQLDSPKSSGGASVTWAIANARGSLAARRL